jgi:hypothetical protein
MSRTYRTADARIHTLGQIVADVPVREFRGLTDWLNRSVNVDRCACATPEERERWVAECRGIVARVKAAGCRRAKVADWDARERALDRSATAILRILHPDLVAA